MKYFTQNFRVKIVFILLTIFGCSGRVIKLERDYIYSAEMPYGSEAKLILKGDSTYVYETGIENLKIYSTGTYTLNNRKAFLTSKFGEILNIKVVENFDSLLFDSSEVTIDSTSFNSFLVINLTVYTGVSDSTVFHLRRTNGMSHKIKFKINSWPISIKLDFGKGFQSNRYFIKNKNANKFKVSIDKPENLYSYADFRSHMIYVSNKRVILTDPKLILKRRNGLSTSSQ